MISKNKEQLIEKINQVLGSTNSNLSEDDKTVLKEVRDSLERARTKEEIIKALGPLANLFQVAIKTIVDIFSG